MSSPDLVLPTPTSPARSRPTVTAAPQPTTGRPVDDPLPRAIAIALRALGEIDRHDDRSAYARRCGIDGLLRDALARHSALGTLGDAATAVPAVVVACAHLAAGGVDDAYAALLAAQDQL